MISYFSLAKGFLTGKYRSEKDLAKSVRGEGVRKYLNARGLGILAAVDNVARRLNSTAARVAIAWLIARPSITAPIASATDLDQLNDLVEATRLNLDRRGNRRIGQGECVGSAVRNILEPTTKSVPAQRNPCENPV